MTDARHSMQVARQHLAEALDALDAAEQELTKHVPCSALDADKRSGTAGEAARLAVRLRRLLATS